MAPRSNRISRGVETKDYRHSGEQRKNVPPAKLADEGKIPKVKKARYYYSPHLSPELRFDPVGKADRVLAIKEKVGEYLTPEEKAVLENALSNQQPWLEWTEKKEQFERGWFEVDPVALHIHERVSAQAIIRAAMREDLQRDLFADSELPYQKEVQFYQHDVDWANRLILGDSLQVMSSLSRRENLAGKVQMIYMDPPYGIQFRSNFQPEIQQNKVGDKETDLIREMEVVKAYRDTWELGLHSYLRYIRDRLLLCQELLNESGSIFVQINDENMHRLRLLMDEVFGSKNFVATIAYKKAAPDTKTIKKGFNYLLWYCKEIDNITINKIFRERRVSDGTTEDPKKLALWLRMPNGYERPLTTEEKREEVELPNDAEVFRVDKVRDSGTNQDRAFEFEFEGEILTPGDGFMWRGNYEEMQRLKYADRLIRTQQTLGYKLFQRDSGGVELTSFWDDTAGKIHDMKFVVQTNDKIISRCILMTSSPGDLIFDLTCGSGTTAYAAEKWGRRWITVDTSRVALSIARQRMLTSKYEYFKLKGEGKVVDAGFCYKTVPHVTLKAIAGNFNLDPIIEKHNSIITELISKCNELLSKHYDNLPTKSRPKECFWHNWQVPYVFDTNWPKDLQDAIVAYHSARLDKIREMTDCIVANAEMEDIVDQPEVIKGIIRVSGPFTVEAVRPEELSLSEKGLFDGTPNEWENADIANEVQNLRVYLSRMIDLIRKDGITFPNNKHQDFAKVEPLFEESTGTPIHAEAICQGNTDNQVCNIGISFGPQYGPVTVEQVAEVVRSGRRYDELVIAGFSFDAAALDALQESQHPKQKIHIAHIRPDVSPGMDGLLKDTPNSQLFTVFGQPEIRVQKQKSGEYTVELLGVDIYDPLTGEVRSSKADKVAAWFLDSDYDGRCFCITQAFFPDQNAWDKIAKSLGSQADPEAFAALNGTVSIPFKSGKYKRVAVKVVDPRGNEVIAVARLEEGK